MGNVQTFLEDLEHGPEDIDPWRTAIGHVVRKNEDLHATTLISGLGVA